MNLLERDTRRQRRPSPSPPQTLSKYGDGEERVGARLKPGGERSSRCLLLHHELCQTAHRLEDLCGKIFLVHFETESLLEREAKLHNPREIQLRQASEKLRSGHKVAALVGMPKVWITTFLTSSKVATDTP